MTCNSVETARNHEVNRVFTERFQQVVGVFSIHLSIPHYKLPRSQHLIHLQKRSGVTRDWDSIGRVRQLPLSPSPPNVLRGRSHNNVVPRQRTKPQYNWSNFDCDVSVVLFDKSGAWWDVWCPHFRPQCNKTTLAPNSCDGSALYSKPKTSNFVTIP